MLYEALAGRPPFAPLGGSPLVVLAHVLESPPRDPVEIDGDLPRAVADVVLRALAKDPDDRPQTAAALREQLDAAVRGPVGV